MLQYILTLQNLDLNTAPIALLPPARPDAWTGMDAQRTYCILRLARDGQAATPRRRPTGRRVEPAGV
jgi:hypothetical protein